jgi:hypothetical protein
MAAKADRFAVVRKDGNYGFILSIHRNIETADATIVRHARALRGTNAVIEAMYGVTKVDSNAKKGDRIRRR